jgi:iodothyronine deiodinase-like protein
MYRTFRDRAAFAFVYIAEAHAVDEWQMESNEQEGVLLYQHTTIAERFDAAREGVKRMRLTLPVLADGLDNAVSEAFAAWPERIYIVDLDGRIAFAGGPGPWAFDPHAAAVALLQMLAESV